MPQYKHREYAVSIATMRSGDGMEVDTEIFSPPTVEDGLGDRCFEDKKLVPLAPIAEIHKRVFDAAKTVIDAFIAQRPTAR